MKKKFFTKGKSRLGFVCVEDARRSQMARGLVEIKTLILAIPLILTVFLFSNVCLSSSGTPPPSVTILNSNNINGEIDPCPS